MNSLHCYLNAVSTLHKSTNEQYNTINFKRAKLKVPEN